MRQLEVALAALQEQQLAMRLAAVMVQLLVAPLVAQ